MVRGVNVRLFPDQDQEIGFKRHNGCCRFLYNKMLDIQLENYQKGNKYISKYDMIKMITSLKQQDEYKWLSDVSVNSLQLVCNDLDQAFKRYFNKISDKPKFKSRKRSKQSFPVRCEHRTFYFKNGFVQIPRIGKVKYQLDYKGKIDESDFDKVSNVRIKFENKKWILTFGIEVQPNEIPNKKGSLGIDLGVKKLATCDINDQKLVFDNINNSHKVKALKSRIKHLQKTVSRKYKVNSSKSPENKWAKTKSIIKYENMIKRDQAKLANIRANQRNQIISQLIKLAPEVVCMEDLNVRGMMKNRHLAKAIGEMGFYDFILKMKQKCELNGIKFIQVDRFFPSSKTCCKCGCIKKDLKLSDRIYKCNNCGNVIDRDYNAAKNLASYGLTH